MIDLTDILEFINKNPWLNIIFIILTLISIFLTLYFYLKSKKVKKPTFAVRTFNLIREKIKKVDSVDILYQGNKINNLSISKIAIWNGGKDTISHSDIALNDIFRIEINDSHEILEFEIILERNNANGFKLTRKDKSTILIDFDYFDFNEGIIIQLYHTATDSDAIDIQGSFKGTKQMLRTNSSTRLLPSFFYKALDKKIISPKYLKKILGILTIVLPIFLFVSLFFGNDVNPNTEPKMLGKLLIIGFVTIPYWWLGFRMLKRRTPKGFNLFEDEF